MEYDYIIIGGGISGLNTLYRLHKEGYNVILFEKTNRLGGRILTYKTEVDGKPVSYESGAGRISENHKLTLNLIRELGLEDKLFELSSEKSYYINRKFYENEKILEKSLKTNIKTLWEKVINYGKSHKEIAMNTNIIGLMSKALTKTQQEILIKTFGYTSELIDYNGYNAVLSIERDFLASKYYVLLGGLEQIIVELQKQIPKDLINLNTPIDKITKTTTGYTVNSKDKEWSAKGIITAVNYSDLLGLNEKKLVKTVKPEHLLRIYAIYPKKNGKVWFDSMPRVITDLPIKYIIPIDYESGLVMISYVDNRYADYWTKKDTLEDIKKGLKKQLEEIFSETTIPEPIYLRLHEWKEGVNYYRPGVNSQEFQEELIGKFKENQFFIGEIFSNYQAWIEGALETSQIAIDYIVESNPKTSGLFDWLPSLSFDFSWIFPTNKLWDFKLPINLKLKIITKEELAKHNKKNDAWIAVDGLVMNVTKFIDKHPGGLAIMNGVGKDATELFNNNCFHSVDIKKNIFPKYIIGRLE
jgi:protoporphyrinogen oxidase/cytochrome b involved in lipid metabolism